MKMAAGVSIFEIILIQIIGFCVIQVGTNHLKDVQGPYNTHIYTVAGGYDNNFVVDSVLDRHQQTIVKRQRREAGDDTTVDSVTTSNTTTTTSATTTSTTTTTVQPTVDNTTETINATKGNFTEIKDTEDHIYYKSKFVKGAEAANYWVDLDAMSKITHGSLSDSHRTAATVKLLFTFPFYGHEVNQVTIATGGFLYMSDFLHQWLTATQYIAPLMANFDSQLGNNSHVHYADNGNTFVVWWEDLLLQDHQLAGVFSFQTILHKDGRIIFNYKDIPKDVHLVPTVKHPVKVGLSDAYYEDQVLTPNVRRRTIYEYHRVEIDMTQIENGSSVVINPLETCLSHKDSCVDCVTAKLNFKCKWCDQLQHCSDGLDRKRQQWIEAGCHEVKAKNSAGECPTRAPPRIVTDENGTPVTDSDGNVMTHPPDSLPIVDTDGQDSRAVPGIGVGGVVAILIVIFLIVLITAWFLYAYMHPQSKAGIWLIEHRPANLRAKLSQVKFWKQGGDGTEKYEVSVHPDGESVA